jgi:putative (di)nucleoside polyphosphate hydrolase
MKRPARYFRAGVGAVISDQRGQILALERSDIAGAWQLPQGGLEKRETPLQGIYREIEEETGFGQRALTLVARYPELLAYELPQQAQSKKSGLGQVQYWFFFRLRTPAAGRPASLGKEFRDAKWVSFTRIVNGAPAFRKGVYKKLQNYFATLQKPQTTSAIRSRKR